MLPQISHCRRLNSEYFPWIFTSGYPYILARGRSVSMATDCGFLLVFLKVEFYCFQGSIQLRIVRMVPVFDQFLNALLAETGANFL